ncbi:hypothetical protein [Terribacillus saccharophilus]|uniref:hypothetical protein n=1 Tax=Terribacillus saccharophilus TaxID=361277 RepID=UPI002989EE9C|nr:hypothetical protein [Terribacillus saccharophilus]MCM3227472.1 hypothetical protein [Terribacillus saccharophilus]
MSFSIKQLDLFNTDSTIYFQTPASHRLRLLTSDFENNLNLPTLREFVHSIFPVHSQITMTGIIGYYIGSTRIGDKQHLKGVVKLSNWKETYLVDEEGTQYMAMTVKDITSQDVFALCKQTAQGWRCSNLMFCTEDRILYISADVFDLVMTDQKKLGGICTKFSPWVDTYHPNIKTV